MIKLKVAFTAQLALAESPRDLVAMTTLHAGPGQRLRAFGWLVRQADGPAAVERYWLADIAPDGVRSRILPAAFTERLVAVTQRAPGTSGSDIWAKGFALGEGHCVLLGTRELHWFPTLDAEPVVIGIEQAPAAAVGGGTRGDWMPMSVGLGTDDRVPVMLREPGGGYGEARHAALLAVDVRAARAHWVLPADHRPAGLNVADYARYDYQAALPPLLLDVAWSEGQWLVYAGGSGAAYHRWGLAPSVLARHRPDLSLAQPLWQAGEESFGRICTSLDRVILTPLRKQGPARGRQSVRAVADGAELLLRWPRGYTKYSLVGYGAGCWWLMEDPGRCSTSPLVACVEG